MKKKILLAALALSLIGAGTWFGRNVLFSSRERETVFYGNVEDRQIDIAFLISERIAEIFPEEGEFVEKGDLLGRVETVRLKNDVMTARADVAVKSAAVSAAESIYEKAQNGFRTEDIAAARAELLAIRAELVSAEKNFVRYDALFKTGGVSAEQRDRAESAFYALKSQADAAESRLERLLAGERAEDIATAEANLKQARAGLDLAKAQLEICEQRLRDAELFSPCEGIVRKRLLEPGEMTSVQTPALSIALLSPKWVRIYLPETLLPHVKPGAPARVVADGAAHDFAGYIGYISPSAEFTPKNIETPELRSSLVYECRVYVNDPENALKLGAPVSVFPELEK